MAEAKKGVNKGLLIGGVVLLLVGLGLTLVKAEEPQEPSRFEVFNTY